MYKDIKTLLEESKESGYPLHKIIIDNEKELTGLSFDLIYNGLEERYSVMRKSAFKNLNSSQDMIGNLIKGQAMAQNKYSNQDTLSGKAINNVMAMALSCSETNASMGRICAAPTAGACGVLPAVLISVTEELKSNKEDVLNAIALAGGIGAILAKNATLSGAEGGCQAECGSAAAMAAAACVYLKGGTNEMVAEAISLTLINCMGLICDPVAGLVQLPCSFRNASQAVNAIISADLALAGQKCIITTDEVIQSMYSVGRRLPYELKETSLGGIAKTATASAITQNLFSDKKF